MHSLPRALHPLRTRGYRWLAAAVALSLLSAGLWTIALVWQVVALGGGPTELSLVTTAGAIGLLVTALPGGVLADRFPQKRILLGVEVMQAATTTAIAALSLTGSLRLWHLAAAAVVGGAASALFYPAYSALLPALLPPDQLLAANGVEGVLRPVMLQAAGPAIAGVVVAASSPGAAAVVTALASAASGACVAAMPSPARLRPPEDHPDGHPVRSALGDLREGLRHVAGTPWILATLLFASLLVLLTVGPFEVLTPFVVRDRAGGGPGEHALVLVAYGAGGVLGSLGVASRRLPRRYLTWMLLLWGAGCAPLAVFGLATSLWPMLVAGFVFGVTTQAATVIWGTLLQRRVPAELLGRVSSLDFFVSLAFLPVSMALAGPLGELLGVTGLFVVAATLPAVLAVTALVAARLPADEIAHPLDEPGVALALRPAVPLDAPLSGAGFRVDGRGDDGCPPERAGG